MPDRTGDDGRVGDWFAHYAVMMLLIVVVLTTAVSVWAAAALPDTEMWSIVVDPQQDVPARQLGVVGEALFQAQDTYTEAMAELGMSGDAEQLYSIVNLRAVPESRLLIVAARTDDVYSASTTTDAMAQALVHAFERSGYPGLRVLGAPQLASIPSGLSLGTVALAAAVMAMVAAFAIAIVLYRVRTPVLTVTKAVAALEPDTVASIPGRGRFLGALRRHPPGVTPQAADLVAARARPGTTLAAPGLAEREREQLAETLGIGGGTVGDRMVIACSPRTRERDLRSHLRRSGVTVELLWIA